MKSDVLQAEIEKRLTLNWLIQGASQHVGMTLHHLIKDDLAAIHPKLPLWYDQMALINQLQWWRPVPTLLVGWPPRWWRRATQSPSHPFFNHPLLAKYGGALAEAFRRRALERARLKGVWRWPTTFSIQTTMVARARSTVRTAGIRLDPEGRMSSSLPGVGSRRNTISAAIDFLAGRDSTVFSGAFVAFVCRDRFTR